MSFWASKKLNLQFLFAYVGYCLLGLKNKLHESAACGRFHSYEPLCKIHLYFSVAVE